MTKRFVILFLALSICFATGLVAVEAKGKPGGPDKSQGGPKVEGKERIHSKQAIMRTNVVLKAAQKAAVKGGSDRGLGLAFGHQKYAIRLHKEGRYVDAIYHTLRARELAAAVFNRNKVVRVVEITFTSDENLYVPTRPKVDELDRQLTVTFSKEIPLDNLAIKLELTVDL